VQPLSVKVEDLEAAYRLMAQDEVREAEAGEWVESLARDTFDEECGAARS